MKKRRLVFSDAAIADILEQADWYAVQSGRRLAQRWEKSVARQRCPSRSDVPLPGHRAHSDRLNCET
jgi:plasmid stabilization system protein ParE